MPQNSRFRTKSTDTSESVFFYRFLVLLLAQARDLALSYGSWRCLCVSVFRGLGR
jgi:hypothetical protein